MMIRLLLCLALLCTPVAHAADTLKILCYHDVTDSLRGDLAADEYALSTQHLVQQFNWLRENGYHVVSMEQALAARKGGAPLPPKSVMLTFDDGYESLHSRVFPLLKLFNYPAVVAIVGKWVEDGQLPGPRTNDPMVKAVSWEQLREMVRSGLVEVASHSHDSHHGILANPQGNEQPALVVHGYAPSSYESESAYLERVRSDLSRNNALIAAKLGKAPRVMVWPYGRYNGATVAIAAELGMPVSMNLDAEAKELADSSGWNRSLIYRNPKLKDFVRQVRAPVAWGVPHELRPQRVLRVDLEEIYDADPTLQEQKLGALLERIKAMVVTTVYLKAFHDPNSDGIADALYFPNRHLPVRADLFNRAAWQLQRRAGVEVIAWLPVKGVDSVDGRQNLTEIYEDLGRHALFSGVLFDGGVADEALEQYIDTLTSALTRYRSPLTTVRQLPAGGALSLSYAAQLPRYDYLLLPITGEESQRDLQRLQATPGALRKTVLEVQDMEAGAAARLMQDLRRVGVWHLAYAPNGAVADDAHLRAVRSAFSAQSYPFREP